MEKSFCPLGLVTVSISRSTSPKEIIFIALAAKMVVSQRESPVHANSRVASVPGRRAQAAQSGVRTNREQVAPGDIANVHFLPQHIAHVRILNALVEHRPSTVAGQDLVYRALDRTRERAHEELGACKAERFDIQSFFVEGNYSTGPGLCSKYGSSR